MDLENTARTRLTKLAETLTGTKYDYAEKGCCCQRAAQRELALLHQQGKVWVSGWEKRYYQWIPVYSPGKRKDVPKPAPLTSAERMRAYRKADPELRVRQNEAKRNARTVKATVGKTMWETMMHQLDKGVKHG